MIVGTDEKNKIVFQFTIENASNRSRIESIFLSED